MDHDVASWVAEEAHRGGSQHQQQPSFATPGVRHGFGVPATPSTPAFAPGAGGGGGAEGGTPFGTEVFLRRAREPGKGRRLQPTHTHHTSRHAVNLSLPLAFSTTLACFFFLASPAPQPSPPAPPHVMSLIVRRLACVSGLSLTAAPVVTPRGGQLGYMGTVLAVIDWLCFDLQK
jgi:hypothetical protein